MNSIDPEAQLLIDAITEDSKLAGHKPVRRAIPSRELSRDAVVGMAKAMGIEGDLSMATKFVFDIDYGSIATATITYVASVPRNVP